MTVASFQRRPATRWVVLGLLLWGLAQGLGLWHGVVHGPTQAQVSSACQGHAHGHGHGHGHAFHSFGHEAGSDACRLVDQLGQADLLVLAPPALPALGLGPLAQPQPQPLRWRPAPAQPYQARAPPRA
jgi:hypothetical protein